MRHPISLNGRRKTIMKTRFFENLQRKRDNEEKKNKKQKKISFHSLSNRRKLKRIWQANLQSLFSFGGYKIKFQKKKKQQHFVSIRDPISRWMRKFIFMMLIDRNWLYD